MRIIGSEGGGQETSNRRGIGGGEKIDNKSKMDGQCKCREIGN